MANGKLILYWIKRYFGIAAVITVFAAAVYNAADDIRLLRRIDNDYGDIMLASKNEVDRPILVNINTASVHMLQRISGIGETTADAIAQYREENGGFKTIDELAKVSGIGSKTLEKIRGQVII